MEELKKYGDTSRVEWVRCDLKSLKQTDEAAKQLASLEQIDAVSLPSVFIWEVRLTVLADMQCRSGSWKVQRDRGRTR